MTLIYDLLSANLPTTNPLLAAFPLVNSPLAIATAQFIAANGTAIAAQNPIDITGGASRLEVQHANAITNAGITFRTTGDRWHVALEGRNLSDKRVITNSFNAGVGSVVGQYNDPRTWSLSVGFSVR